MEKAELEDSIQSTGKPEANGSPGDLIISAQSIDQIESTVCQLSNRSDTEQIIVGLNLTALLVSRVKTIRRNLEQIAVEWIEIHGPIDMGDIRYIVGHPKVVSCTAVVRCTHMVLESCGGDVDALTECFSSVPYKYGSVRRLIGDEQFGQVYREERRPKLVEGKVQPQLLRIDQRFVK